MRRTPANIRKKNRLLNEIKTRGRKESAKRSPVKHGGGGTSTKRVKAGKRERDPPRKEQILGKSKTGGI